MPAQTAEWVVAQLQKNYGKNYTEAGLEKIWPDLISEPAKAMEAAFDVLVTLHTYLPSPAQFLAAVQAEGKKIRATEGAKREKEWAAQKGTRQDGSIFSRDQRDDHARHAIQLVKLALNRNVSREHILEGARVMEENYPGVGWGNEGARLQRHWERRDKGLESRL